MVFVKKVQELVTHPQFSLPKGFCGVMQSIPHAGGTEDAQRFGYAL